MIAAATHESAIGGFAPDEAVDIDGLRWLAAGDRYCLVEFARTMDLATNLRVIQLADRLLEERLDGVIESLPMFVSVLVHYNSEVISPAHLRDAIAGVWREIAAESDVIVPSRLIEVPACYRDPWTAESVAEYARTIKPIGDDPTYVAEVNGFDSPEAFARRHAFTEHWVGGVGFWPGLPDMMPIDPRCQHSVPKYDPPRISTVAGAIGVGGGFTSIYPMDTPGGYHLIGRTPIPIFSTDTRLAPFRYGATLFRPGDRVRFRPIDVDSFRDIEGAVAVGAYRYEISDYTLFSLERHRAWCAGLADDDAADLPW